MSETKASRRKFLQIAGTGVAALAVGAAVGYYAGRIQAPSQVVTETLTKTETALTETATTETGVPKPSSLTMGIVAGPEATGIKAMAPVYEQATGIHIELPEYPYSALYEKFVTTFEAGAPTFDLIMSDDVWMPKWGSEGWLTELDTEFGVKAYENPDIPKTSYWLGSWPPPTGPVPPSDQGKPRHVIGLSIVGNMKVFAYRTDLISTDPQTWDDVMANAKKVNNPSQGIYGYVVRGAKGEPATMHFLSIMKSFGGDFFADDWRIRLTDKEVIDALKFELELLKLSPPGSENFDAAERARAVAIGQAAQAQTWPAELTDFIFNTEVSKVIGKVKVVPNPGRGELKSGAHTGNWLMGIPKSAAPEKKYWAWNFMQWLLKPEVQREYALRGGIPVLKSIDADPELQAKYPYQAALLTAYESNDARIDRGQAVLAYPRTPELMSVVTIVGTYINAALAGLETAESAMQKAAQELLDYLKAKGYPVYI